MRWPILVLVAALAQAQPATPANLVENGGFDRDVEGWSQWFSPGQADGEGTWSARDDGGCFRIDVRRRDSASAVQIYRGPFPVTQDAWYAVEFEARAEAPTQIRVSLMLNNPPYGGLGLTVEPQVGPTWRRFAYLVQASTTTADGRLDFFLPVGLFELDNVVVRPVAGEPPKVPVQTVHLGRGVSGKAADLIDGKEETRVWLGGYPAMPAFITLDLGQEASVALVRVTSEDRGQHLALGKMACEVSRDGRDWREWGAFSKAFGPKVGAGRLTTLTASGEAVPVRYVRLRVLNVMNSAPFREATVFAASTADPVALVALPKVIPSSLLAFEGWDYGRNGYDLSVGESCALRFANQSDRPVLTDISWTLETFAGETVAKGKAMVDAPAGAVADARLSLPADLPDGHYRIRFAFVDGTGPQAFHFDHRRAVAGDGVPRLAVGAYLDCQDPEGWVWLSAGPLAKHLDVQRRLGKGPRPDALLVAAEAWDSQDERVREVHDYVRAGGLALCYGKLAPAFDDLLPVVINREKPRLDALVTLDGKALGLSGTPLRQQGVRCTAKADTTVLAAWSNGTPAVVEGRFGQGRVVFVGAGLGRAWTQEELALTPADRLAFPLLYRLLRDEAAAQAARAVLDAPATDWCAERLDELSMGRFGWQIAEGGLVENFDDQGRLSSPASTGLWGPRIPGREIVRGVTDSTNWLAKRVRWLDAAGGEVLATTISMGAPCLLWESAGPELEIEVPATFMVCEVGGKTVVRSAGEEIPGRDLTAGWLVLPSGNAKEYDAPRYVQFARKPASLLLQNGTLKVRFPAAGGVFWTGRLFGLRRFAPGATAGWAQSGVPKEVTVQARQLARLCLAFPVSAEETGEQEALEAFWRVADTFSFRREKDEFGTEPLTMAPVPPVLALVHQHSPQLARLGRTEPLGVATKYGPLLGVPGNRLVYSISQVADEHYGVVPGSDDQAVQKLADFHGLLTVKVGERAPSGLVSGGSNYLADLREYMSCSSFQPLFAAPCLDLYKWWYCFPSVAGRPVYSPEAREQIDAHYRLVFRDTLDLYPHKTIVRYRREPWTGKGYTVSFIWPVSWKDGVRYFVDQNESSAVIAYCLWTYAQYYGDWDTVRQNWHLARWLWEYLPRVNDWALMCSSNQEYYSTAGIDMLNSEYPGNLAMARLAQAMGDRDCERLARYLAAKSAIPAVARFLLPAYVASITAPGDPWRQDQFYWSMQERDFGGSKTVIMRGDTWSILQLGIGMYDTSKGTGPEITALYKAFVPEEVTAYERAMGKAEREYKETVGWAHLMSRAFLGGWAKSDLVATAERSFAQKGSLGWQSTKYPHNLGAMATATNGFHLVDWQPAAYVTGVYDAALRQVVLDFANPDGGPVQLRAHSVFPVTATTVEGGTLAGWRDDPATGTWTAQVDAAGDFRVTLPLSDTRRVIPCIYVPPAK